jgi:hypothetical protein
MTPEEIEARYGKDILNMMYDSILQNPVHELADWILSMYTEQDIKEWAVQLLKDEGDEE